jgi:hypothetical protein
MWIDVERILDYIEDPDAFHGPLDALEAVDTEDDMS